MRATFDKDASIGRLSMSIPNRILGTNLPSFTDRFPMLAFRWKSRGSNNYINTKCVQLLTKMPALEGCQSRFQIAYSGPTYRASQTGSQCWHFDENRETATTILKLNACNFWQRCQHWKAVNATHIFACVRNVFFVKKVFRGYCGIEVGSYSAFELIVGVMNGTNSTIKLCSMSSVA